MSELNFTHSNGNKVKLTTPDTLAANKTFKLPGADGSSGQFLKTNGSGALSFATPSLPTQPHAFVFMDSQYFTTSATKMHFNNSLSGDISSGVTITRGGSERLTPTVAGTYLVQTQLMFSYNTGGSNIQFVVFQYKNGSEYAYNTQDQQRGSGLVSNVICQSLMTFNGSSDYVEMYAKHNGGGNAIMGVASTFMVVRIG